MDYSGPSRSNRLYVNGDKLNTRAKFRYWSTFKFIKIRKARSIIAQITL